ncbi:YbaN family protein [candidate division WOR-3 bacterium]|nr:YbaN family protein [candidate division WOR-3 bacterium]
MKNNNKRQITSNLSRWVLIITGSFFMGLGILGIFLPLLPTTPFLLIAAACYIRSSEKFYNWLINNKWLGNYIKNYIEGKGVPLKVKVLSISLLWITIGYSVVFIVHIFLIRVILILIAIGVTIHILSIRILKQRKRDDDI